MISRARDKTPRSLSDASPGDVVRVRLIVFELVRSRCWDLPLREGDTLQLVDASDAGVVVSRLDGSRLVVPSECALFIGVETIAAGAPSTEQPAARTRERRKVSR